LNILIAIDDGHGMTTPGKRTPFFPNSTRFMHENEFNKIVAQYLKENLERCGFKTLMVAPGDDDVPLKTRTDRANHANAAIYISIHANALNGIWGRQQGISTHHFPKSVSGRKLAETIHKYMIQGTQQKNRGIKEDNFHVLRETNMPAVLVECAFMDNLREAGLLLTDEFRRECADEMCKGICEYFGVKYIPEMTFVNALDIVSIFANIDKSYWTNKRDIDKYFPNLIIKIAKAISAMR